MSNTASEHIGATLRSSRSIQEFRLDFLLEEEFSCDPEFSRRFLAECAPDFQFEDVIQVQNEVNLGSSIVDLLVIFRARRHQSGAVHLALLIEDKITAGSAQRQGERYRRDGEAHRGKLWDQFKTVLVAPASYVGERDRFDVFIALERLKDCICLGDPARASFRRSKIDDALAKKAATGVQVSDLEMREFRRAYYEFIGTFNNEWGTDLQLDPPRKAHYAGDTWLVPKSPSLPDWCRLRHKIRTDLKSRTGKVELAFPKTDFAKAEPLAELLDPDMCLIPNGKHKQHVAIEIDVPEIRDVADFVLERHKVEKALQAVARLVRLFHDHRLRIEAIVVGARRST